MNMLASLRARTDWPRIDLVLSLVIGIGMALTMTRTTPGLGWPVLALILLPLMFLGSAIRRLAADFGDHAWAKLAAPVLLGVILLLMWEILVGAFDVPKVILPAPSLIWATFLASTDMLWIDFKQTVLKAVFAGFAIGAVAAFAVALLADRSDFLKRGILPVGAFMAALPIIGIAPIFIIWFGSDWHSKAAVVTVIVFFPILVNTSAGLTQTTAMQRDLIKTYNAGYWSALIKLRLPAALPFVFNGLKIASTLAMIGAIVAEFFGSPTTGMGFRISTSVGRLEIEVVWSEIIVAAVVGSTLYGLIALIERWLTFWHPSQRRG